MSPHDERLRDAIAVVGMAARLPGAANPRAMWRLLVEGRRGLRTLSSDELERVGVSAAEQARPGFVPVAGDLAHIEDFDADYFGLSRAEATVLDPQQRLLLELACECFEDAGQRPSQLGASCGVFVGAGRNDYLWRVLQDERQRATLGTFALEIATSRDFLATRIAYLLDLRGPALSVQTACSTSLVAVHVACQSLLSGECDAALAGGVSIRLPQATGMQASAGGVISHDGHCRAFDADASGSVPANGGGLVLLRPLAAALADGAAIHGVLLATAVNNDGADKVGFTAPSVSGQAAVVAEALELAGVEPASIGYVEAHGTGTRLGDPIEIAALAKSFPPRSGAATWIGSLKSNFGHLDAGAGIAGLLKALCVVREGVVPVSLDFRTPNPELGLAATGLRVVAEASTLEASDTPRRAGVSSFGIGGTNAHAIVEQAPWNVRGPEPREPRLVCLSARSRTALAARARDLAAALDERPDLALDDVAWTLAAGREAFAWRASFVARDTTEAKQLAQCLADLGAAPSAAAASGAPLTDGPPSAPASVRASDMALGHASEAPRIVWLFPGQGTTFAGMGRGLRGESVFAAAFGRCTRLFAQHGIAELERSVFGRTDAASAALARTDVAQAALFALGWSLAELLGARGVVPDVLVGHSIGELTAAAVAGVFTLEDAVALVALRGRAMQAAPAGAMLAVASSEAEVARYLSKDVALAAVNGPALCVVSGAVDAIAAVEAGCAGDGVSVRRLAIEHAFHSPAMAPAAATLAEALARVDAQAPRLPWIAARTAKLVQVAPTPADWALQLTETVRAFDAVRAARASLGLELGPGRSFAAAVRASAAPAPAWAPCLASADEQASDSADAAALLAALGVAWTTGLELEAEARGPLERGDDVRPPQRVHLPTYPFERERLWVEAAAPFGSEGDGGRAPDQRSSEVHDLLPSREPLEQIVRAAWSAALGLDELGPQTDFFAAGGSSLVAIQVVERIGRELGTTLSTADLVGTPRLADFVARVRARQAGGDRTEDADRSASVVVGTGPAGVQDGPPIWLFPGVDGEALPLAGLARRLGAPARILRYGAGDAVVTLARGCAEEIRQTRAATDALRLVGWSFGGWVAFETARILVGEGLTLERLVVLDTHSARDLPPEELAAAAEGPLPPALVRAAAEYVPRPAALELDLILADDPRTPRELTRGRWEALVDGLRPLATPGDHRSMLRAPHVDALARHLANTFSLSLPLR